MSIFSHIFDLPAQRSELLIYFTLIQLSVIILVARIGGEIARRIGQAAVVGEIIAGIVLGPSLLGLLLPDTFHYIFHSISAGPLDALSQLGLTLLMFQVGLEFDFSHLKEKVNRNAVLWVAVASILAPFILGLGFALVSAPILSPQAGRWTSALFIATAFAITAVPVLGRIMMELGMTRSRLGVIAISAAAINDVVGWLLLALVTTLALSHFEAVAFVIKILLVISFIIIWILGIRPLMKWMIRRFSTGGKLTPNLLGIILISIFVSGLVTSSLGIFTIFGGFIMGVILHDADEFANAWAERVSPFVLVFFLPIFFTYTGLRTNIGGLDSVSLWGWCGLTLLFATAGKFAGAYGAARISGLNHHQAKVIGIMMNTRALMELIVINVGYDLGAISQQVFTMLVIMAIFSTIITTPFLRVWLPRAGMQLPAPSPISNGQKTI
ncbi:cation:proton antiporter [Acidithiobacillus sp. AMEEHan]|uniref:cation:proton antiporter n=1 Tax=Acidithiobacillus sp. AMEEHan TaxID=2994951 RepID=UPI0027E5662B|nr:cation:proton antiporter [Acidithiobacillus sp. AMEEHan]